MSVTYPQRYTDLGRLFGCYLHHDYDIYGGGLGGAVRALARGERREIVLAGRTEIVRFPPESCGGEDAGLDALDDGRAHPPGFSGRDYLRWIASVPAESVQQHAAE